MKNKLFILTLIFLFSVTLRIWNLNQMGRTWDEPEYVEQGYRMIELLKKRDFSNSYFYTTYDHPPLVKYLYGLAAHLDVKRYLPSGEPILSYDLTFSRGLSSVVSSLAVVVVVMLGWQFISRFVGIVAGIILTILPFFLGLSQLVTAESWVMLFFSAAVFSYMLLLKDYSLSKLIITGVFTGVALQVKQSNGILLPLFILLYAAWFLQTRKGKKFSFVDPKLTAILFISVIGVIVFILFWPTILFHFQEVYSIHKGLWNVQFSPKLWQITLSPPEVFFGRLMLTPVFYYFVYFLITTPILILALFFVGLKVIDKRKEWILYAITIWFFIPFLLSFYSWRQHGVRYIIQIYAPFALIAAIGFDYLVNKFTKNDLKKIIVFIPVVIYMLVILVKISPYYLDYFNLIVGGTKTVYEKKMFQIGWWGQGVREAALYVSKYAPKGSMVGLAISPMHVFPPLPELQVKNYNKEAVYDYVIVNYYNILREGFDDSDIRKKYKPIYHVYADGAVLTTVYKRK